MKTKVLLMVGVVCCAFLMIQGRVADKNESLKVVKRDTSAVTYSGNIKTIIDNKCYGCHNSQSRGVKARIKLNLDSLALISKVNQLSKLDKIIEVLDKGDMPPKRYLEQKPEGKMTDEETAAVKGWAQKASDILMK
jgi:hypothetical protein